MRKDPPVSIPVDLRAVEAKAQYAHEVAPGWPRQSYATASDFDIAAAHIAAVDPPTVLAMVEALRIAREALWGIAVKPDEAAGIADAVLASLDALVDFTADPQEDSL